MSLHWTPQDGEIVHLHRNNPWKLAAGRYELRRYYGEPGDVVSPDAWDLVGVGLNNSTRAAYGPHLVEQEAAMILTPIPRDQIERDRRELGLRIAAPLRGNRSGAMLAQHDASELALFRHAAEPRLAL